ncbi:MAG: hypothetical protein DRO88_10865 [Promethearchaeia archaeon]|nr:MAG: hypothetical protein DRO88_10865 [Candidatus Lokiarchaeia archaeon]
MNSPIKETDLEEQAQQNYMLGCSYLEEGNFDKAGYYFSQAVEQQPKYLHAWNNLGVAYYNNKNYEAAEFCFKKALEINPQQKSALINICYVYKDWEKWERFFEALKRYFHLFPSDSELPYLYLSYFIGSGEFTAGIQFFEEYFATNSITKDLVFGLMDLYEKAGQYKQGIEKLKNLLQLNLENQNDAEIWNNLGYFYELSGDFLEAKKQYQQALKLNEKDPLIWTNTANMYVELNDLEKSLEAYKNALNLAPKDPVIINNFCDLALKMDISENWEKFAEVLEKSSENMHDYADKLAIYDTLLKIYIKIGNSQKVEKIQRKIKKNDSENNSKINPEK